MNVITLLLTLLGCLLVSVLGWKIGRGTTQPDQVKTETSATQAPISAEQVTAAVGPYEKAIEETLSFRGERSLEEIERALGAPDFTTLGASARSIALLQELEEDEVLPMLDRLLKKSPLPETLIATALGRWASGDPKEAIRWADEHLDEPASRAARNEIASVWARQDPKAALKYLQGLYAVTSGAAQHRLGADLNAVMSIWAQKDPEAALGAVIEGEDDRSMWFGFCQLAKMDEYRVRAFELVLALEDDEVRSTGVKSLLRAWTKDDPVSAAAWLDENDFTDSKWQWAVSQSFQRADPEANADWLLARSTPETRDRSLTTAIAYWSRSDPAAASRWVETSDILNDGLAAQLATGWSSRDANQAFAWARRIGDEAKQRQSIGAVLSQLRTKAFNVDGSVDSFDLQLYTGPTGLSVEELQSALNAAEQMGRRRF